MNLDTLFATYGNAYCAMQNAGRQEAKYAATPAVEAAKQAVIDHFGGAAVRGEAVAESEQAELIELLRSIRPNYGAVGSRDVDVTATRKKIDAAITILSVRAADAPSEPSGLTFDQWLDRKDENGWTEREAPCGEFRDMLRGWNAAMKFGKSRAADALDSQPTDGGVRNC